MEFFRTISEVIDLKILVAQGSETVFKEKMRKSPCSLVRGLIGFGHWPREDPKCRASAGVCDLAEACDGATAACPANGFAPATTQCRASAGVCSRPVEHVLDEPDGGGNLLRGHERVHQPEHYQIILRVTDFIQCKGKHLGDQAFNRPGRRCSSRHLRHGAYRKCLTVS